MFAPLINQRRHRPPADEFGPPPNEREALARKISNRCTVCQHRERAGVDLALARGVSVRALASRYKLHRDALYRHQKNHLPPQLRASLIAGPDLDIDLDKLRETESQSLLANLVNLRGRLFSSLDVAEECRDGTMLARIAGQQSRGRPGQRAL